MIERRCQAALTPSQYRDEMRRIARAERKAKAEAASAQFVWDEGYYLAQYKKHTTFHSDIESFTSKKDGTVFPNPFYKVPVSAMVFDLLGFAGRKGDAIVEATGTVNVSGSTVNLN